MHAAIQLFLKLSLVIKWSTKTQCDSDVLNVLNILYKLELYLLCTELIGQRKHTRGGNLKTQFEIANAIITVRF